MCAARELRVFTTRSLLVTAIVIAWCPLGLIADEPSKSADFYVAPDGNDAWSGRCQQHQGSGNEGPLATLDAALQASRKTAESARKIVLGPGAYYLEQPLVLDDRDSGLVIEGAGPGKTILYGGRRISDWHPDGDRFWAADLPEVRDGKWDFRALVVNDRLCPRARQPETDRFEHESSFSVPWMSTAGGGWQRKPTQKELTTLQYRTGDLPANLSIKNAEITVYHMWDESLVGLAAHDPNAHTLTFSNKCTHPPGAFDMKTYVVWNTREGMTQPGQWYLDRDQGRVVYWPLPGEDMAQAKVVAPCVETIIDLRGTPQKNVRHVALRGMTLSATTTACKPSGFAALAVRGAICGVSTEAARLADVEVTNVAGNGVAFLDSRDACIERCQLHHLGAGGCRLTGKGGRVESSRIADVGLVYPSASGLAILGDDFAIRGNEIYNITYCGMCLGGNRLTVEQNVLHHCMQVLHDGAAIYMGGGQGHAIRRNVVRDCVAVGKGYGVSSYYLDEKCRDCVVENNLSVGVQRPTHNHMTLNCTVRNNTFLNDGDMDLSFPRSTNSHVVGNTVQLNGKLTVSDSDAVVEWSDNLIVQSGDQMPTVSTAMPTTPLTLRENPLYGKAILTPKPPTVDGKLEGDEWPSQSIAVTQLPNQRRVRGGPVLGKVCVDATHVYIGTSTVCMFPEDRHLGHVWATDEGSELTLGGVREDGSPVTYVLRGYLDGTVESLTLGGATEAEAKTLAAAVRFVASADKGVWHCEWAVPFAALRFTPKPQALLPMNVTVFRSEDQQLIQWAGTLGETWDLRRGGRLIFADGPSGESPPK